MVKLKLKTDRENRGGRERTCEKAISGANYTRSVEAGNDIIG